MRRPLSLRLFRSVLSGTILIALPCAHAQVQTQNRASGQPQSGIVSDDPSPILLPVEMTGFNLPDSPGTVLRRRMQSAADPPETASVTDAGVAPNQAPGPQQPAHSDALSGAEAKASDKSRLGGCSAGNVAAGSGIVEPTTSGPRGPNTASKAGPSSPAAASTQPPAPCPPAQNPYQRFLNSTTPIPLTPRQKGYLAIHNFIDPGNIITILGSSGIAIASDSHTAYGPGWRGFGKDAGISAVEDATGDFFGTFLIPSLTHEDPHYHRMPNASIPRRTLHAISRTVIAQHDDGHAMPNYATLLTYPITAEIANLYVPGVATNGPATVERVLTGYATDPIDNLITEFLPDVAKRIHVRVIFVQQIINQVASGQPVSMF